MSNRQIQPVRPRDYQLTRQVRPRSLWGQIWTIALQPGYFFSTLPPANDTRQWFSVAVLILGLVGFSAVRQEAVLNSGSNNIAPPIDFNSPPGTDLGGSFSPFGNGPGVIQVSPGSGIPSSSGGNTEAPSATTSQGDVSSILTTGLIAASHILLGWFILATLLSEVPLFNGTRPSFSQNLQIAIWTSFPIGVMAGVQVIFYAAGGGVGESGLSGLLTVWNGYNNLAPFPKSLALSLAIRLTLFWIWSLILLYRGGRNALNGKRWAVLLVVAGWIILLVVIPVITGSVSAEQTPPVFSIGTDSNNFSPDDNSFLSPVVPLDTLPTDREIAPTDSQTQNQPLDVTPEATENVVFAGEGNVAPPVTANSPGE